VDVAHDWRVKLLRHGDAPIQVAIDVRLSQSTREGDDLICWVIRPLSLAPSD
jgi:hypothetical protein